MCSKNYSWHEADISLSEFLRLAAQYRRRAQRQLEKQCGTPSWAPAGGRKRRSSVHESPSKRVRDQD